MLNNTIQLLAGHQSLLKRIDQNLVEFRITASVLVDLAILAWSKVHNDKVGRGKPIEGRIDCSLIPHDSVSCVQRIYDHSIGH